MTADDKLSAVFPSVQSAIVTIKANNIEYSERVDFPKGEPENPLTDCEFRDRYNGLMEYAGISSEKIASTFDSVYQQEAKVVDIIVYL